jgi:hypothetical protein
LNPELDRCLAPCFKWFVTLHPEASFTRRAAFIIELGDQENCDLAKGFFVVKAQVLVQVLETAAESSAQIFGISSNLRSSAFLKQLRSCLARCRPGAQWTEAHLKLRLRTFKEELFLA